MPLALHYVRSLEQVIPPAEAFLLRQQGDLFARPRIVVPTAGAKAWLEAELARRVGAGDDGRGDGIVANVGFVYPAAISSLLEADAGRGWLRGDADPWEVERLTFTILDVIVKDSRYAPRVERAGGPLLAARAIADRFDHYHVRRPGLILAWEAGRPELSPAADEQGNMVTTLLASRDRWQFDLWRAVRERIGEPSPPLRDRLATAAGTDAVFVAGLQSLSLHHIELLDRLSELPTASGSPREVEVLLVHPSPALRSAWATTAPPVSAGIAPIRSEHIASCTADPLGDPRADPLVAAWLRGTRESQWLLASQGKTPTHDDSAPAGAEAAAGVASSATAKTPLLSRLQHTITSGRIDATPDAVSPLEANDHSLLIHRCHDLGRQAEVLHDAILHAFGELDDLAPHDVVIVSPQIAELAPHLEATFNRAVKGEPNLLGTKDGAVSLPLVVADRSLHEISTGAELLTAILALAGSRCSVDGMLAVAAHPLVVAHFHLDDDDVDTWRRCIVRTKIRWGLDALRRERAGLAFPELSAHSWRLGLERMVLGGLVSDGDPEPILGDVVPLAAVEAAEVTSLTTLVSIFGIVDSLDLATAEPRPVRAWCDLIEEALVSLAGETTEEIVVPLEQIDALRKAALADASAVDVAVPFHDVKTLLARRLTSAVGRQPLLTGVITATSMIPLRGVPFRVICVAGFDEAAMTPRESDGEDLTTCQDLLGDPDPRLEIRRSLLDSLLAAGERLVITCTGRDVKNNATLPLVTPLAELVDLVGRHGVPQIERDGEHHSVIEIFHPRHACSRSNFVAGNVLGGGTTIWSHDNAARAAAEALSAERPAAVGGGSSMASVEPPAIIELDWLAEFVHDPLWPYVVKTLDINVWRDDDPEIPATLPLELEPFEARRLRADYIERLLVSHDREGLADAWAAAVQASGDVPVLGYGGEAIDRIVQFSHALLEAAAALATPLDASSAEVIHLDLEGITLTGTIQGWHPEAHSIVLVRPDAQSTGSSAFGRAKSRAFTELLAARAAGHLVEQALIFCEREEWHPGKLDKKGRPESPVMTRHVILDEAIDAIRAHELLADLARLYQQAAVRPHGLFGATAATLAESRDAAEEAFAAHLSSRGYAHSKEAVIHGLHPDFHEMFPVSDSRRGFFDAYRQLTSTTYHRSRKAYVYTAPAHSA